MHAGVLLGVPGRDPRQPGAGGARRAAEQQESGEERGEDSGKDATLPRFSNIA